MFMNVQYLSKGIPFLIVYSNTKKEPLLHAIMKLLFVFVYLSVFVYLYIPLSMHVNSSVCPLSCIDK